MRNSDGTKLRGLSGNQICIGVANEKKNTLFLVEDTGKPSQNRIFEAFGAHMVQVSYALNRIYTKYYRSRGKNFDITNSTAYDQAYVQALFLTLRKQYPGQVGRYHSEMGPPAKKTALEQYQSGEIRILVSCKALDEGLNVPQTDVGIILSGTATARQSIQRLGRILRRRADGRSARLYVVYVNQAQEEDTLELATANIHGLTYDSARDVFIYPEYESLCQRAYAALRQRGAAPALLEEAEKNMRLGVVRGDFRLSAEVCRENLQAAKSTRAKNYWITMSFLIEEKLE